MAYIIKAYPADSTMLSVVSYAKKNFSMYGNLEVRRDCIGRYTIHFLALEKK